MGTKVREIFPIVILSWYGMFIMRMSRASNLWSFTDLVRLDINRLIPRVFGIVEFVQCYMFVILIFLFDCSDNKSNQD